MSQIKLSKSTKLGIIGLGNMGEAIVAGLLKSKLIPASRIFFIENFKARETAMKKKYKINACNNIQELSKKTNALLVAIKPQQLGEMLAELSSDYNKQLIITIVAGIQTKFYTKHLGKQAKIARVMPNTPALLGVGATALYFTSNLKAADKKTATSIFDCVGITVALKKESELDIVTAVSGSGPAFVYQFAQSLISAGTKLGLNAAVCKQLVLQTLLGATQMMINSKDSPDELTKKVTSKKGTTDAGLQELRKKGFTQVIKACIQRAAKRAKELSQEFGA
jgi:pyrroline-5-carboxylate reductase